MQDQIRRHCCGVTTATLAANTPAVGTGAWTITSGAGGTVTTPTSPTSTFTGVAGTAYVLRWTISNAPCTASTDDVSITFNQTPTVANAGPDQTGALMCGLTTATLAANTPAVGTGAWTIISGYRRNSYNTNQSDQYLHRYSGYSICTEMDNQQCTMYSINR